MANKNEIEAALNEKLGGDINVNQTTDKKTDPTGKAKKVYALNLRVSLHDDLEAIADEKAQSISALVSGILADWVRDYKAGGIR